MAKQTLETVRAALETRTTFDYVDPITSNEFTIAVHIDTRGAQNTPIFVVDSWDKDGNSRWMRRFSDLQSAVNELNRFI